MIRILFILLLFWGFASAEDKALEIEMQDFIVTEDEPKTLDNELKEITIGVEGVDLVEEDPSKNYKDTAVLRTLDKITARTKELRIHVGEKQMFGQIEIIARACYHSPVTLEPENRALLELYEHKEQEQKQKLFYGWMFASSPSISALEHPVYDINVIECVNAPKAEEKVKDTVKEKEAVKEKEKKK